MVVVLATAAGCSGGGDDGDRAASSPDDETTSTTAAPDETTEPAVDESTTLVAVADVPKVAVYAEPDGGGQPIHQLDNPTGSGSPLVFTVDGHDADGPWLHVNLPVRPNGSQGYVRSGDVKLQTTAYRVKVELAAHRLTVTKGDEVVLETPIGVGTADTPTPGGVYYIKELLRPPDPAGDYGPYAYGLSGFSNQPELANFNGGEGIIGIHGTNQPDKIGTDVSHGCIRVANDVITEMASYLPLGTPVEITA
ncbi:MAG TPA: L,D-transpeptidase [Acidimicrobiales bacterium]|nr:L,D-transpeptidase [Acidimicrobiales bacterium]